MAEESAGRIRLQDHVRASRHGKTAAFRVWPHGPRVPGGWGVSVAARQGRARSRADANPGRRRGRTRPHGPHRRPRRGRAPGSEDRDLRTKRPVVGPATHRTAVHRDLAPTRPSRTRLTWEPSTRLCSWSRTFGRRIERTSCRLSEMASWPLRYRRALRPRNRAPPPRRCSSPATSGECATRRVSAAAGPISTTLATHGPTRGERFTCGSPPERRAGPLPR